MTSQQGDIFVGRAREMAALTAALDDSLAGRGRLVMLVGEPGIGKTRTAEELAAVAHGRGVEVLWGRCPEERGAPPYWPWVQVIGAHAAALDERTLRSELGNDAGSIAEIVPGIAERVRGMAPPRAVDDPESARFRLFDGVTSFLKRASEARPVLIALDDLHWADGSSLRLLEFVASGMSDARLLLLGTYRDVDISRDHLLFHALGSLTRQRRFERVTLRGLDEQETGQMFALAGAVDVPTGVITRLRAQTEGNPLFVGEIVRLLGHQGMLTRERWADQTTWDFPVPESVREVIGRRLNLLPKECNEALTVAAVIGHEFDLDLLARLFPDIPEDSLLEILEAATQVRVIEETPRSGRYQFSHALVQTTLADELSLARRVRLHARIGAAIESLHGADAQDHAAELAITRYLESGSGPECYWIAGCGSLRRRRVSSALRHLSNTRQGMSRKAAAGLTVSWRR
jgi:predicted ATPase